MGRSPTLFPSIRSTGIFTGVGLAITLLILLYGSFLGYRSVQRTMQRERWVAHSDSVILGLQVVLGDLKDAETGHRGYVITHDTAFLAPYEEAERRLDLDCSTIAHLLRDNKMEEQRFRALKASIDEKMRWVGDGQALVRAGRYAEGTQAVRGGEGQHLMVRVRDGIQAMQKVERALLIERTSTSGRSFKIMLLTIITSAVVGLVLLMLVLAQSLVAVARQARMARVLHEERERLRVTLASIGDALISTDERTQVTYLNPVAEALTGWTSAEAEGLPLETVFRIVNEASRQTVDNPVMKAMETGTTVGLANHTLLIAKDGTEVNIDDSAAPIKDGNGKVIGCVLIFRDIRLQRKAERELWEKSTLLRTALESADLGSWALDTATGTFNSDDRYKTIFGTSVSGLTEKEAIGNIHPEDQARVQEAVTAALNPEHPAEYSIEYRVVHEDASVHWVYAKGSAQFSGEGTERTLTGFAGTVMDITRRREADDALRKVEERLSFVMDSMPQKVLTAKKNGEIDYLNPAWMKYTGRPEEELHDWSRSDLLHPDDLKKSTAKWMRSVESGEPYEDEYRVRRADGEYRWHLTRLLPMRNVEGTILLWVGAATDIHDQRETADRLRQYAADISESDRHKTEFIATLAHELRGPLAPINNMLEILRGGAHDATLVEKARATMQRQLDQMVLLVDDLLDIGRISQGKIVLRKRRVELSSILEQAVEVATPLAQAQGHELATDLGTEALTVEGDPVRLAQIFSNLLNNACKYTPHGGTISLRVARRNNEVQVSVKDSGIGIATEDLDHVFVLFAQVSSHYEGAPGGLGIGLALVKKLVEMHGGSVEAKSEGLGAGSEFIVRLPLLANVAKDPARAPDPAQGAAATPAKRRILVVDDNIDGAQSMAQLLKLKGHVTAVAHDGEEALEKARSFVPDLVLLDVGLPKINGHEVCKRIRSEPWGSVMVIIAVTGWGQDEDRRRTTEAGFDAHMVKPITIKDLYAIIAQTDDREASS